jgi:hypothetical protein
MTVQAFPNPGDQDLLMGAALLGVIGVALLAVLPTKQLREAPSSAASVTVSSYSPGRTAANEYTPSSFETAVTPLPDARLFSVPRALGHTVCTWVVSV